MPQAQGRPDGASGGAFLSGRACGCYARAVQEYLHCQLCPRECGVDRTAGGSGVCRAGAEPVVAWAGLHHGEEPPITGAGGSGTIFFTGCTLGCSFCQNHQLSRRGLGRAVSVEELAAIMTDLQAAGARTVNLVTASHFTPSVLATVGLGRRRGLDLPVVWNSSGYESRRTVEALLPAVDVFLPDCKSLDSGITARYMSAPGYPAAVREALPAMVQAKPLLWDGDLLRRGVIVRHLVLPGELGSTREVLRWFASELAGRALLSLMFQYTPAGGASRRERPAPARCLTAGEYRRVFSWLQELGIKDGFIQDPAPDPEWLPDFRRLDPFPPGQARTLWHYRTGGLAAAAAASVGADDGALEGLPLQDLP